MGNPQKKKSIGELDGQDKGLLGAAAFTAVVGVILIVIGFVLRFGRGFKDFVKYAKADDDFLELGRLDIIFGVFTACAVLLVLLFFLCVVGVIRVHPFLLKTYAAGLGVLVIAQIVVGLLAFTYADDINNLSNNDVLYESLNATMTSPYLNLETGNWNSAAAPNSDTNNYNFWSHTQHTLQCCGVVRSADWSLLKPKALEGMHCTTSSTSNEKGCQAKIRDRIKADASYFGAAALGFLVVELVAAFLSFYRTYTYSNP